MNEKASNERTFDNAQKENSTFLKVEAMKEKKKK